MKHDWEFYGLMTSGKYHARCRACDKIVEIGEHGISIPSLELAILERKFSSTKVSNEDCEGKESVSPQVIRG